MRNFERFFFLRILDRKNGSLDHQILNVCNYTTIIRIILMCISWFGWSFEFTFVRVCISYGSRGRYHIGFKRRAVVRAFMSLCACVFECECLVILNNFLSLSELYI